MLIYLIAFLLVFGRDTPGLFGHFFLSSIISLFFLPLSGRRPDIFGWLVVFGLTAFETVFQSISGRLPKRGRKSNVLIKTTLIVPRCKLKGTIVMGSSVRPSVRQSVRPSVDTIFSTQFLLHFSKDFDETFQLLFP